MNEEPRPDLEILELGDAKEETKGWVVGTDPEEVPVKMFDRPL